MKAKLKSINQPSDTLLAVKNLCIHAPGGRPLIQNLNMKIGQEHIAILGRNGVGKSALLLVLSGKELPSSGRVDLPSKSVLVPQDLPPSKAVLGKSPGELRVLRLLEARQAMPDLLLLDEPTQDLDDSARVWLSNWLRSWPSGLLVISHDRALLSQFEHFFIVAESGCRYFNGPFHALEQSMADDNKRQQQKYLQSLTALNEQEAHNLRVCQRRERKKNLGRLHELGRAASKMRLNNKRSYAQVSQGRVAKIRKNRIHQERAWAKSARRALQVNLSLTLPVPKLCKDDGQAIICLDGASARVNGRALFEGVNLKMGRSRLAITGPNGSGKTTLLNIISGDRAPQTGKVKAQHWRIGNIKQGATDWTCKDTLLTRLNDHVDATSPEALAQLLLAHKFPLALAERPLYSLSPGERVRAALICLFERRPPPELLILDEPTYGLDFVGFSALKEALRCWPGGLIVVSHDRDFIESVGVDRYLSLDGNGGHTLSDPPPKVFPPNGKAKPLSLA